MQRASAFGALILLAACGVGDLSSGGDSGGEGAGPDGGSAVGSGVAPAGTIAGEVPAGDGANPVAVSSGGVAVLRVEAHPGEHVALRLDFAPTDGVLLSVDRWDGAAPVRIGETDAGKGLRVLAVLDPSEPRTFWATVSAGGGALSGMLTVTRTPFEDAPTCSEDCARLLQLPLPNDPAVDGYANDDDTVFRYQFGRRDLLMFLRNTARIQAAAGKQPIIPQDLSQWNGETPGTDVGAPRHASHQRGKDADVSLYGTDGLATWRSHCTVRIGGDGRECIAGTTKEFDAYANAVLLAPVYATGRVTMCFLDRELIQHVVPAAADAGGDGAIADDLVPLYGDGVHLQHWPNHDNHVHIRVAEDPYGASGLAPAAFEPP